MGWRTTRRTVSLFAFILVLSASSALSYAPLTVEWKQERLSVVAEQVPLARVLQEVAHRTGLKIQGRETLHSDVSVHFSGLPLGEALDRLLAHVNYLTVDEPPSQGGTQLVLAVLVFGEKAAPPAQVPQKQVPQSAAGVEAGSEGGAVEETPRDRERLSGLEAFAEQGDMDALQLAMLDPNPPMQVRALTLMLERDTPRTLEFLMSMTKSNDPAPRLQALHLLYMNGLVDPSVSLDDALKGRDILPLQDRSEDPS